MSFETTRRIRRARLGVNRLNSLLQKENIQLPDVSRIESTLKEREINSLERSIAVLDVKDVIKNAGYIARVARDHR